MAAMNADLDRALEELEASFNVLDLEQAWINGLRAATTSDGRDHVLIAAAARVRAFGPTPGDDLRMRWLGQIAQESIVRGVDGLSADLAAAVSLHARDAFVEAADEIVRLDGAVAAGDAPHDYVLRHPIPAGEAEEFGARRVSVERNRVDGPSCQRLPLTPWSISLQRAMLCALCLRWCRSL